MAWPVPQQRVAPPRALVLGTQVPTVEAGVSAQHTLSCVAPGQNVTEAAVPDAVLLLPTHSPALQMVRAGVPAAWTASLRQSLSAAQAVHVLELEHTFPSLTPVQSRVVAQSPITHDPMVLHT